MNAAGSVSFEPSDGSVTSRPSNGSRPASTAALHTSPWLLEGYVCHNFWEAASSPLLTSHQRPLTGAARGGPGHWIMVIRVSVP